MAQLNPFMSSAAATTETQQPRPRVLVVDDHDGTRDIIMHILQKEFDVVTLADGAEAWERIKNDDTVKAVITDINLPNMSGIEIMQQARAHADERIKNLPIIAITGAHDKDLQRRAYLGGVTGFIYKPIDMAQLKALMHAYAHEKPKPAKDNKKDKKAAAEKPAATPAAKTKAADATPPETKTEDTGLVETKADETPSTIDFAPASAPAEPLPQVDMPAAQAERSILDSIGEPLMALDETPAPEATAAPTSDTPAAPSASALDTLSVEELEAMIKEVSVKPAKTPAKPKKAPVVNSPGAAPARNSRVSIDDALTLLRDQPHK